MVCILNARASLNQQTGRKTSIDAIYMFLSRSTVFIALLLVVYIGLIQEFPTTDYNNRCDEFKMYDRLEIRSSLPTHHNIQPATLLTLTHR